MSDVKLDPIKGNLISGGLVSDQGRRLVVVVVVGGGVELLLPLPPGLISCQCNAAERRRFLQMKSELALTQSDEEARSSAPAASGVRRPRATRQHAARLAVTVRVSQWTPAG